jgi:hypothetical protein
MTLRPAIAATLFACLPAIAGEHPSVAGFTPVESEMLGWRGVDDGVMGGLSQGGREIGNDGIPVFFGTLSLERCRLKLIHREWRDQFRFPAASFRAMRGNSNP